MSVWNTWKRFFIKSHSVVVVVVVVLTMARNTEPYSQHTGKPDTCYGKFLLPLHTLKCGAYKCPWITYGKETEVEVWARLSCAVPQTRWGCNTLLTLRSVAMGPLPLLFDKGMFIFIPIIKVLTSCFKLNCLCIQLIKIYIFLRKWIVICFQLAKCLTVD